MRVIVTAGPTREHIDTVRFITNASSGRMGYACAAAAVAAGHEATLITGPVALRPPAGCQVVNIVSIADLKAELDRRFDACDALLMSAAVGDFTVQPRRTSKIPRAAGAVQITLAPTQDILAGLGARKRPGQLLVGFAVEDAADEDKGLREMLAKNCDYYVLNPPAAMGASSSEACILSRDGLVLEWGRRTKAALARKIVELLR
jgi:phosphopantothenoylcysteine decarboxylase/phosphopantothenate--cysteine ligase